MKFKQTLQKLGFSPTETTVYVTLCEHGSLTGYEVAKLTGISRSNVYAALYNLQEKGKCYVSEGETTKYVALSKEELLLSAEREMKKTLSEIKEYYPETIATSEPYITIRGYENVLDKVKNTLSLCESHVYILSPSSYIKLLEGDLLELSKHRRITIISEKPLDLPASITVYVRQKAPEGYHMIIDTKAVLTGELQVDLAQCLFSRNISLVRLMRESFITELDMIKLKHQ